MAKAKKRVLGPGDPGVPDMSSDNDDVLNEYDDDAFDDYYDRRSATEILKRKKEIEKQAAAKRKKTDKEAKRQQAARIIINLSEKEGISTEEAEKIIAKATTKTDATGLNFATTPAEAAPQEEPISGFDRGIDYIDAGQRRIIAASDEEQRAAEALSKKEQEQFEAEDKAAIKLEDDYGKQVRALEAMQAINRAEMDDFEKGMAEAEEDYNNSKIDPNRAFSSTGSKVAAAIAIALGAFAQGMSRGQLPNSALQIIEGSIKRDIDAQKTEMQKNRDVLLNKNNIYARMMARFKNEEVAYQATMAMAYKHAGMKMTALLRKHKGEKAQLTINAGLAAMEAGKAKSLQRGQELKAEIAVKQAQFQARSGAAQTKRSESIKLAQKVLRILPRVAQQFGNLSAMEGIMDVALPDWTQEMFAGMGDVVNYKDSRNLAAKMLTKAFDGGRPTEKDFAIFVAMFPGAKAEQKLGLGKFDNISGTLNAMIVDAGGLEPGFLTKAWGNQKLTAEQKAAGKALSDQAKAEEWETRGFKQEGN